MAEFLVRQICISEPSNIIDICCGSCNLLHAAGARWPKAKLCGVDILAHYNENIDFIQEDGRKFAIEHPSSFDLVLANPPFENVNEKNSFPQLYDETSLKYCSARLEIEMLFSNLKVLRDNGTLIIIMPSTFATANRYKLIRCYLAQRYYIQKVIWLPNNVFGTSMINCCAIILKKTNTKRKSTRRIEVQFSKDRYYASDVTPISNNDINDGKWEKYATNDVTIKVVSRRGNISSQHFVDKGIPILHTSKYQHPWKPSVRYISEAKANAVYADYGDILVSRVGKSAGQWCRYDGERMMISDCLYVIKDPQGDIAHIINEKQYSFPIKGVTTHYITMRDFLAWIESLN